MTALERFRNFLSECPLVAIIRGVTPDEAPAIGEALFAAGIRIIEVPLNSPSPFESIRRIAGILGDRALIGAGTVLDAADVSRVVEAGGEIVVAPNVNRDVIAAAVGAGLVASPGYFTPSEAFEAINAGAQALKLFPAEAATPAVLKAQRAVLPANVPILVVGGVRADTMQPWREAGADGFGLGSGVYKPGQGSDDVARQARAFVDALNG